MVSGGGKPAGKADPKKDAKAAPAKKGGAPTEDKNAPKAVNIDYPDQPAAPNYAIFEKSFAQMKIAIIHEQDLKHGGAHQEGSQLSKKNQPHKEITLEEKKANRTKELLKEFQIVRGLPFTLSLKVRYNLPEEVIEVKKEPEPVVDPKKKK
jgi:hypothetical protein